MQRDHALLALEAGVDANSTSEEDQTALMSASLNGKPEAIRALLRKGANVNAAEAPTTAGISRAKARS
mgnify:CR=1 FL=1